jgi:Ca-activated chloride channel homolog
MNAWKLLPLLIVLLFSTACGNHSEPSSGKKEDRQETKEENNKQNDEKQPESNVNKEDTTFQYPSSLTEAEEAVPGKWWKDEDQPSDSERLEFVQKIAELGNKEASLEAKAAAIDKRLFDSYHPELLPLTSFEPRGKITIEDLKSGSGLKLNGQEVKENINVAIILDASGSMKAEQNGKSQMQIAKDAIEDFVSNLPEKTNVSLTIYGYEGSGSDKDKQLSCKSIKEIYPLKKYDNTEFQSALSQVEPKGWTPIAASLKQAGKTLENLNSDTNTNVIYLVSDGEETCDGDPAKAAEQLVSTNIQPIINVIGFAVGEDQRKQLEQVAEAAKGRYIQANNQQELVSEFKKSNQTLVKWINWRNQHTLDAIHQKNEDNLDLINLKNTSNLRLIHFKNQVNQLLLDARNKHDMDQEVFSLTIDHLEDYFSRMVEEMQTHFDEKLAVIEATYEETTKEIDETYESNKEE